MHYIRIVSAKSTFRSNSRREAAPDLMALDEVEFASLALVNVSDSDSSSEGRVDIDEAIVRLHNQTPGSKKKRVRRGQSARQSTETKHSENTAHKFRQAKLPGFATSSMFSKDLTGKQVRQSSFMHGGVSTTTQAKNSEPPMRVRNKNKRPLPHKHRVIGKHVAFHTEATPLPQFDEESDSDEDGGWEVPVQTLKSPRTWHQGNHHHQSNANAIRRASSNKN